MNLHAIGIDLGKTVFHLVGLNQAGDVQLRKKFSRTQLLRFTTNVQVHLIGMEACAGSHFLGKALREQGHEARPFDGVLDSTLKGSAVAAAFAAEEFALAGAELLQGLHVFVIHERRPRTAFFGAEPAAIFPAPPELLANHRR